MLHPSFVCSWAALQLHLPRRKPCKTCRRYLFHSRSSGAHGDIVKVGDSQGIGDGPDDPALTD